MDYSNLPHKFLFATGLWVGAALIWYIVPPWALFVFGWLLAAYSLVPMVWADAVRMAYGVEEVDEA